VSHWHLAGSALLRQKKKKKNQNKKKTGLQISGLQKINNLLKRTIHFKNSIVVILSDKQFNSALKTKKI
jgi:hypothetical protein